MPEELNSDARPDAENKERRTDSSDNNPFLRLRDLLLEWVGPLQKQVSDLNSVIYGDPADRHDMGLTHDVSANTEFRRNSETFRKWLIGAIIVFVLTTIANLAMMALNYGGQ